ncbi:PREDICTED: NACHT, LRR and PYD domains-containing protein 9-like [Elephantulus edwardii]|uniref:NACHT, LRR and PYD domains-containing protein 9-like n=1 Tax=Elephantulus edwardii TaxID=28737 RepID=UPI0003F0B754|nr:PREDICTED: NACHT, LRR and PYD domains-containing protein 9-like [Elephantulus edwardii]
MADLLSNYGLLPYLEELQMEEFSTFKELLKQEIVKRQRRSVHGPELTKGTRHDVVTLLEKHYTEKQAWEMMLMVLLQIDKRNIWEKAKVELRRKLNPYRLHMKEKFHLLWRNETCLPIPDCFYEETIKTEYEELRDAYASEEMGTGPRTVVLRGPEGMGKTTLLRKVMLEWTEGNLWRDVFTFVFFLDGREMNHAGEMSFLEFISKDWPESSQQLESVFCQSQDILFIIDDLEACKFELRLDNETCDDWHQKKHIDVLLGSLLQKKILPDSSLLLALGPGQFTKNYFLLQQPKCIVVRGFSEHQRKSYFSHFFHEHDKAKLAVSFLEEQQCLSPLCQSPLLCWLLCLCVKWQLDRGEDLEMTYQTTTSLFVSFFINTVKTGVENLPVKANMDQVIALCSLATRGIWTQTYLFRQEEFRQLGISQSSVSTWIGINLLQRHGSYIAFIHKQVQEFYATLFYYLELPKDFPSKSFDNLLKFTITNLCNPESTLPQMRLFLVGLMTEKINRLLDTRLDLKLAEETKKTVMDNLKIINLMNKSKMDFLELFHILFETREQEFVMKVMAFITEASIHIGSTRALMVASYCLAQSRSLRYLNLYIENVFSDDSKFFSMNRKLGLWEKLCSVLITNKDLQVLELNKCSLSDASLDVLCKVMAQSFCKVKTVVNRKLGLWEKLCSVLITNKDLQVLELNKCSLSDASLDVLCKVMAHLGNCGIVSEACDDIAPVLMCNKKLSHLSFLQNCLKDDGVRVLCDALKHPNCVLTILV